MPPRKRARLHCMLRPCLHSALQRCLAPAAPLVDRKVTRPIRCCGSKLCNGARCSGRVHLVCAHHHANCRQRQSRDTLTLSARAVAFNLIARGVSSSGAAAWAPALARSEQPQGPLNDTVAQQHRIQPMLRLTNALRSRRCVRPSARARNKGLRPSCVIASNSSTERHVHKLRHALRACAVIC